MKSTLRLAGVVAGTPGGVGKVPVMGKTKLRCGFCGRRFEPDRYNAHHRKYCLDPDCVRDRKRKRQREWSARRKAADAAFAERGRKRCREANRARRKRLAALPRSPPCPVPEAAPAPDVRHALLGLLAQMTDTADSGQLHSTFVAYAARGQRLAASGPGAAMPP